MLTRAQSLGQGVVESQIAKGFGFALSFFITILLTRWMGPEGYGSYSLILGWIGLASLIVSLGFLESLNKYIPVLLTQKVDIISFFTPLLTLRFTMALSLALVVKLMATNLFDVLQHPEYIPLLDSLIILFLLYQAAVFLESFFVSQLKINIVFISTTFRQLVVLGGLIGLFLLNKVSLGPVLGLMIIGYIVAIIIFLIGLHRTKKSKRKWELQQLPVILKFSFSAWIVTGITFLLSEQTDVLLLGFLTTSTREIGIYKAGTALVWKFIGVITVSSQVVLSSLSFKYMNQGEKGLTQGWQSFTKLSIFSIVPLFVFLGWHAPTIIGILYGADYSSSALVLRYFVILTGIPFGLMAGGLHLMALYTLGYEKKGLSVRITSGLMNLVLGIVLIRSYAAIGAVIATGLTAIVGTFMEFFLLQRSLKQPYPLQFAGKVLGSVMLSSIVFILFPINSLGGLITVGFVYGVLILLLLVWWKPLTHEDYLTITRLNSRLSIPATWFTVAT